MIYGGGGLALSLGVSQSSPWDLHMANLNYRVVEYDASIEKSPYIHPNISFHKNFVSSFTKDEFISLEDVIKENKLNENTKNILQIDIENAEWDILENLDLSLFERYFPQVIFEFHGCNPEEFEGAKKRFKILERLNKHYKVIHTHFNNHGKIWYSKGYFFSTTIEVSYLRNEEASKLGVKELRKNGIIKGLDFPTFVANPELPIRF